MVVKWNLEHAEEGQCIAQLPNSIYALHHRKETNTLLVGHNYEGLHELDWQGGRELRSLKISLTALFDIQSVGNDIWVADGNGCITIIDASRWVVVNRIQASEKSARTIAMHPTAPEVAVGFSDCFIRVYHQHTYQLLREWKAHENSVFALHYAHHSQLLLSGARDARLKAWQATNGYALQTEVIAHLFAINHIAFSPDNKHFVTCSLDKSIKVWQAEPLQLLKVIDKARHAGHGTSVNKLLWTSFDQQLVSASDDRTLSVWNIIF